MSDKFDSWVRWVLGLGTLAFGVWGQISPSTLADRMGVDVHQAEVIGWRDLGSGALILGVKGPFPYFLRSTFDVWDALSTMRSKPKVAAGAALFGLLAASQAVRLSSR